VGQHVTQADLDDDWVLSHEMIHFGFPSVEGRHHWIEVGIATYVEPIARAQVGRLTAERVWHEMVDGMPQGLPAAGDQGLDNTHTWGRTHWGARCSASWRKSRFESRQAMPKGLRDALRAINRAVGTIEADWPLERVVPWGSRSEVLRITIRAGARRSSSP
jgi:hypothetical protein